jgi:hypothetical protein
MALTLALPLGLRLLVHLGEVFLGIGEEEFLALHAAHFDLLSLIDERDGVLRERHPAHEAVVQRIRLHRIIGFDRDD